MYGVEITTERILLTFWETAACVPRPDLRGGEGRPMGPGP